MCRIRANRPKCLFAVAASERAHELELLLLGLEATVAELGRGVDETELDRLGSEALAVDEHGLAHGDDALGATDDGALDHEPVLVDDTVVDEAAHGVDVLLGEVALGRGRLGVTGIADAVDLLVDLGTVVVTVLTGTGHGERDTRRVPRANAGDLAETTVSLARKTGDAPTGDDTVVTTATGDTHEVDHLERREDTLDVNLLLEEVEAEVDLLGGGATVDLDLEDVGLLLAKLDLLDLRVGDDADDLAVLLHAGELLVDVSLVVGPLLAVLGERLSLGGEPVLVEAALALLVHVLGPHGGEGAHARRGLGVANEANNDHLRALNDGDSLDGLLLVELGARALNITEDVGAAGLVAHEGGEVAALGGVILRERPDLAAVLLGALLGEETKVTGARLLELTVRHAADRRRVSERVTGRECHAGDSGGRGHSRREQVFTYAQGIKTAEARPPRKRWLEAGASRIGQV